MAKKEADKPLTPEDHHLYRKGVGILLYLAPERPDLMFTLKKLSMKLASPTEGDLELLRFVGKYLKGCPDIHLLHKKTYPGCSFQEKRNRSAKSNKERDIYKQQSLIEICSDSDWAADRTSRQSVSCGAIMLNGNLVHFQSKRQRSVALSSCESETIAAVSIMSEGVFLQKLVERITGIVPEVRLYLDSSSSRQLISRKGLGKARHMDVSLLWIQKLKGVLVKAIKGTENPADLGTKALSRDKIAKYLRILGYRGDFVVEQDEGPPVKARQVKTLHTLNVGTIAKIVALIVAELGVVEGVRLSASSTACFPWVVVMIGVIMFTSVAISVQAEVRRKKGKSTLEEKLESKKRKKEDKKKMAEEQVPKPIEEEKSEEEREERLEGPALDSKEVSLGDMQGRAEELRKMALQAKAAREKTLEEELEQQSQKMAEEMVVEGAAEETTKKDEPGQPSGKESESSSEEEEEKKKEADDDTVSSATDSSVGEAAEETSKKDEPGQPSLVSVEVTANAQSEDQQIEEHRKLVEEFNEKFLESIRPTVQGIESCLGSSASRSIGSMFHCSLGSIQELYELTGSEVHDLQSLGLVNDETLKTVSDSMARNKRLEDALDKKIKAMEQEFEEFVERKRRAWVQSKAAELRAERTALEKSERLHGLVEKFVELCMRGFKESKESALGQRLNWLPEMEFSKKAFDKRNKPTLYEKVFTSNLEMLNSGKSIEDEIKEGLAEAEAKVRPIMIENIPEEKGTKKRPAEEPSGSAPKLAPKPKKAPFPPPDQRKDQRKDAEAKAMPKKYEEMTLPERPKKVGRPEKVDDAEAMPKGIEVDIDQEVWNMLSKEGRNRIQSEKPCWHEECFFCQQTGHRAYFCKKMLKLGETLTRMFGQQAHGGSTHSRQQSIFCTSCWFRLTTAAVMGSGPVDRACGWWSHSRNICNFKSACKIAEDDVLAQMSELELAQHLAMHGLSPPGYEAREEEKEEPKQRAVEITTTGPPEKKHKKEEVKKRKDEEKKEERKKREDEKRRRLDEEAKRKEEEDRKNKEKEEEERKRREAEEFKKFLRGRTKEKLHGYLFDSSFRCPPHKMEEQVNYEKKLPFEILAVTPNYVSRVEELNEYNKKQIEEHNARMLREEQEVAKKLKEREEQEVARKLKEKEERKAARKEEKRKAKEEEKKKQEAAKTAKKEKKEKKKKE